MSGDISIPRLEGVGMAVVVKRFYMFKDLDQDLQDWLLIGYGSDRRTLFIVAEYFPNGSLENHIYRETRPKSLPWETRLNISIGVAQCLAFLHSWKKTSLSRRYLTASKSCSIWSSTQEFPISDSKAYLTLKKGHTQQISPCSSPKEVGHVGRCVQLWCYILLQMLTGLKTRRIILEIRNDSESIAEMIDPDLENSYPIQEGIRMCEIIKQCLEEDPKNRPSMQQVLDNLNAIART
ncbi:unnamed protein product [Brassica napus]|uniref:(rape) hypothetical protein n=1 Tax=Brassica napus TaxID=3708 RepID=A0A816IR63_BRANA|nr:unnamed protein product [Brassica napus]